METELHPQYKTLLIAVIIGVALLLGIAALYLATMFPRDPEPPTIPMPPTQEPLPEESLSGFPESEDLVPEEAVTNPVQTLPSDNPFEAQTNPFEDAYTNPFE